MPAPKTSNSPLWSYLMACCDPDTAQITLAGGKITVTMARAGVATIRVRPSRPRTASRSARSRGRTRIATVGAPTSAAATRTLRRAAAASGQNSTDRVFAVIDAAPNGISAVKGTLKLAGIRPNHLGLAISRLLKSGRVVERDGRLYAAARVTAQSRAA